MPNIIPKHFAYISISTLLIHLFFITTLLDKYYHLHFTNKDTELQGC